MHFFLSPRTLLGPPPPIPPSLYQNFSDFQILVVLVTFLLRHVITKDLPTINLDQLRCRWRGFKKFPLLASKCFANFNSGLCIATYVKTYQKLIGIWVWRKRNSSGAAATDDDDDSFSFARQSKFTLIVEFNFKTKTPY